MITSESDQLVQQCVLVWEIKKLTMELYSLPHQIEVSFKGVFEPVLNWSFKN